MGWEELTFELVGASGERGWVKTKNRDYWRWELEREGVIRGRVPGKISV